MKLFQRVLVTNDDGIDAPGLVAARAIAGQIAEQVWVVAPMTDQSGVGQSISMHGALRVTDYGDDCHALSGTPADCVMYALATLFVDKRPNLVLSGVNWGGNLSDSVMYSGTVGAALAADHFDIPAIALSQAFHDRGQPDFSATLAYAVSAIDVLWARRATLGCCWNINFPMLAAAQIQGLRFTRQSPGVIRAPQVSAERDADGAMRYWLGFERNTQAVIDPVSDVVALRQGFVSATPLQGTRCDDIGRERAAGEASELSLSAAG